jgi:hypothetical protein
LKLVKNTCHRSGVALPVRQFRDAVPPGRVGAARWCYEPPLTLQPADSAPRRAHPGPCAPPNLQLCNFCNSLRSPVNTWPPGPRAPGWGAPGRARSKHFLTSRLDIRAVVHRAHAVHKTHTKPLPFGHSCCRTPRSCCAQNPHQTAITCVTAAKMKRNSSARRPPGERPWARSLKLSVWKSPHAHQRRRAAELTDCGTRGGWYYARVLRPAGTARHSSSATPSNFTRAVCPMRISCMPVAAPVEMT